MAIAKKKIPLIYILSQGHSGSTLLDLILGSHSQIESIGELKSFRSYFDCDHLREDTRCTCGVEIKECEFWSRLGERVNLEGIRDLDCDDLFEQKNREFLQAVLDQTGKSIICDSSKTMDRLERYLRNSSFDVSILHLVRDGRAVAYSLSVKGERLRKKKGSIRAYRSWLNRMEKNSKQYSFFAQLKNWKINNVKSVERYSSAPGYLLVKYEDLASDPERTLEPIMKNLGLIFEQDQLHFFAREHHNLSGNRMKRKGAQKIERDVRYLSGLGSVTWALSTFYIGNVLRKLRYPYGRR